MTEIQKRVTGVDPVTYEDLAPLLWIIEERLRHLESYVKDCRNQDYRTIAIIGRTAEECRELHQFLEFQESR